MNALALSQACLRRARDHRAAAAVRGALLYRGDRPLSLDLAHGRAADDRDDAARARCAGTDRSVQRRVHPHGLGAGERSADGRDCTRAFPKAAVTNAYGTTEAGPGGVRAASQGPAAAGECRSAIRIPKVQLRLVDGDNRNAVQGVLEMKCPALMNGYHNRPDVKPPFTPDGYYITGDVFRRDDNGFHYFVGRTDDMFVSGGENIYPADVERMLERHPDVAQAAWSSRSTTTSRAPSRSLSSSRRPARGRPRTRSSNTRSPTRRPTSTRALSGSSRIAAGLDQQGGSRGAA